jgi:hypothetical protein
MPDLNSFKETQMSPQDIDKVMERIGTDCASILALFEHKNCSSVVRQKLFQTVLNASQCLRAGIAAAYQLAHKEYSVQALGKELILRNGRWVEDD